MPWFDPPVPYDPPWPPKLQVFGLTSMAIGMSSPFDMKLAINGSLTQVQPGRAKDANRRYPFIAALAASRWVTYEENDRRAATWLSQSRALLRPTPSLCVSVRDLGIFSRRHPR
jgi:hypothetical protein